MATTAAIGAVSAAMARLLEGILGDDGSTVTVVNSAEGLKSPADGTRGFTLFLIRVLPSTLRRPPQLRRDVVNGVVARPSTYIDAHYLVTAWASSGIEQHKLLGLAVQTLGNGSVLTPGLLNLSAKQQSDVFGPDESLEVLFDSISLQDLVQSFALDPKRFQVSLAYVVRGIGIDADQTFSDGPPVELRDLAYSSRVPVP